MSHPLHSDEELEGLIHTMPSIFTVRNFMELHYPRPTATHRTYQPLRVFRKIGLEITETGHNVLSWIVTKP